MMRKIRTSIAIASLAALGGCAGCALFQDEGTMTQEVVNESAE